MSPIKEPHFFSFANDKPHYNGYRCEGFNKNIFSDIASYKTLFSQVDNEKAVGECSTSYLYYPMAAANIKTYIPDCKIIIILRSPVDRAFSFYSFSVLHGFETLSFEEGLSREADRIIENWIPIFYYTAWSYYYEHVKRYIDTFGVENVKIYLFDDLRNNPIKLLENIWKYLDVDHNYRPDLDIKNISGLPKSWLVHNALWDHIFIKRVFKSLLPERMRNEIREFVIRHNYTFELTPDMKSETRIKLLNLFKDDILKLQSLINRDLSMWLRK